MKIKKIKKGDVILIPKGISIFSKLLQNPAKTEVDQLAVVDSALIDGTLFVTPKYVQYPAGESKPKLVNLGFDSWSVLSKNVQYYDWESVPVSKTLKRFNVCTECKARVRAVDSNCICNFSSLFDTIELEFEVCECCGKEVTPEQYADTEFNKAQIADYEAHIAERLNHK